MPKSFSIKPKKRKPAPVPSEAEIKRLDQACDDAYREMVEAKEAYRRACDEFARKRAQFHSALRGTHNAK